MCITVLLISVAINKCDREEAEPDICIDDLSQHGVILEEAGGDVMGVKVSALKGNGYRSGKARGQ